MGLMGLSSLCVLIKVLGFSAIRFICTRYFCWFLSIIVLHLCIVCSMYYWYESVRSLVKCIIQFSCIKISIFCFNVSLYTITMVLPLSTSAIIMLFCSRRIFICFRLHWRLLCNVLYVFVLVLCLIILVARYLNVFCILMSKCLIAFSVSIISVLINCFWHFKLHSQILSLMYLFVHYWVLFVLGLLGVYRMCISLFLCYVYCEIYVLIMSPVFYWVFGIWSPPICSTANQ